MDLKNKFTKLESDLEISRNVSNKLVDQVTGLEWNCCEYNSTLGGNVEKHLETLKYPTDTFGEDIIKGFW